MLLLLVYSVLLVHFIRSQELTNNQKCFYRCTASCVGSGQNSGFCEEECSSYNNINLCNSSDCWSFCRDLGPPTSLTAPSGIHTTNDNGTRGVRWSPVSLAGAYLVQLKEQSDPDFSTSPIEVTGNTSLEDVLVQRNAFCDPMDVRVASASKTSVSGFSEVKKVDKPKPGASPKLLLKELKYLNRPFVDDFYEANGTIQITFEYKPYEWTLGDSDLQIEPMFHMITCSDPDLSQGVPIPQFAPGPEPNTVVGFVGSDMMYRKCRFVYYVQEVRSKTCGTNTFFHSPPPDALQTMNIECGTVLNNPCVIEERHEPPVCGQVEDITYKIMNDDVDSDDVSRNLTVNVTFVPMMRTREAPTLYYVAFYGIAMNYKSKEEEAFLGVNITKMLGRVSNCKSLTSAGLCAHETTNDVFLEEMHLDTLYGITFCAVKDPKNLTFPDFLADSRQRRPKANRIYLDGKYFAKSKVGLIVGVSIGAIAFVILCLIGLCLFINKKQKAKNDKFKLKITQLQLEKEHRYTDFPKKNDIWEIERRNLIIHDDKKLGSGAFGAVYLGKLLGKSLGHKDANSPLGVNIMRAENCEVAVKMLPEYADEMSKSEFLREIGLMKTLGYHERLVNMLACVTDSEPLCLVVEYCSDGDLLHFLRDRCKYMMKLDEVGINYQEPPIDDNYDIEKIITMKQLLMYAVQISYGLEYLSQKGFVHRDVAARNILVNDINSCKIGDFGLCRFIYADSAHYKSKGGRLPLKWMSPEAIRHYEFSTMSDVWSFGILLFEIITLGGSPYPGVQPEDMLSFLEDGGRMEQPDNCPDEFYSVMVECWHAVSDKRPEFSTIRQQLAGQLEDITEEYSYLKLDAQRDYYNVQYKDEKHDIIVIPETDTISGPRTSADSASTLSIESIPMDSMIIDPNADIDRAKAAIKAAAITENQENRDNESISISMSTVNDVQNKVV